MNGFVESHFEVIYLTIRKMLTFLLNLEWMQNNFWNVSNFQFNNCLFVQLLYCVMIFLHDTLLCVDVTSLVFYWNSEKVSLLAGSKMDGLNAAICMHRFYLMKMSNKMHVCFATRSYIKCMQHTAGWRRHNTKVSVWPSIQIIILCPLINWEPAQQDFLLYGFL